MHPRLTFADLFKTKEEVEEAEKYARIFLLEEKREEDSVYSATKRMEELKEEMSGVSETLDEVPSDIIKKWLVELSQINASYLDERAELIDKVRRNRSIY